VSQRAAFIKGGAVLSAGNMGATACSFVRNVIIARMLSVDDVGVAATFAMTTSLMEMASNMALDRLIVQAPDGDDPRLQAAAQFFQFVRGVIGAIVLFAIAGPVAQLFGIPDVAWAFRLLAVVPLLRGLSHLDVHRAQRTMHFTPFVVVTVAPQLVVTALAPPLAWWLDDFRAVLWIVLMQAFLSTALAHLMAERRYAWAVDRERMRRIVAYGWPLLINGALMYAIFQGDRAIVGSVFTMEDLGWYATVLGLTFVPSMLILKILTTLIMPRLSRSHDGADGDRHSQLTVQAFTAAAVVLAVGAWTVGPLALVLIYGERYAPGALVIGWLGLMQALRVMKAGPATVALSTAKTTALLWANMVRLSGLALAIAAVWGGYGFEGIAIAGVVGECFSLITAIALLKASGVAVARAARSCLTACAVIALVIGIFELISPRGSVTEGVVGTLLTALATGLAAFSLGEIRRRLFRTRARAADSYASRGDASASRLGDGGDSG